MQIKLLDGVKEHADNQIKPYSETIQELRAQYAGITIAGIEDRDGYKAAAEAAKTVRAERLALQKQAGGIVKTLNDFKTKLQARAKSIIGQYSELEEEIRTEMSRIDEEKRAEKERQRLAELKKFNDRTDLMFETGFVFDGYQYKVGTVFVVSGEIGDMGDEEFNELVEKGRQEAERLARIVKEAPAHPAEPNPVGEPKQDSGRSEAPPRPLPEWMPEPTIQSFPDPPDQPSADPNYRPPGFTAGFDACRNEVLAILGRKEKFTRAQLRGMVEQLKP